MSVKLNEKKVNEIKKNLAKTVPHFFGNKLKEPKLNEFVAQTLGYKDWNTLLGVIKPKVNFNDLNLLINVSESGEFASTYKAIVQLSKDTLSYIHSQTLEMEDEDRVFDIDGLVVLAKINSNLKESIGKKNIKNLDEKEEINYVILDDKVEDELEKVDIEDEMRSEYPQVMVVKSSDGYDLYFYSYCKFTNEKYSSYLPIKLKDLEN